MSYCFFKWVYSNKKCPLCRKQLIRDLLDSERETLEWLKQNQNYAQEELLELTHKNNILDSILKKKKEKILVSQRAARPNDADDEEPALGEQRPHGSRDSFSAASGCSCATLRGSRSPQHHRRREFLLYITVCLY